MTRIRPTRPNTYFRDTRGKIVIYSVRPTRFMIFYRARARSHSGKVSNAAPYLHSKELRGQQHGVSKSVDVSAPEARWQAARPYTVKAALLEL